MQLLVIFVSIIEANLDYLVSGFLNIRYPLYEPAGEMIGLVFAYVSFGLTFVLMPIYLLFTLSKPLREFRYDSEFLSTFGLIY